MRPLKERNFMENNFKIRSLCADDIFPMCDIIGKCGIAEFKNCFLKNNKEKNQYSAGVNAVFEMAGIICKNISACKNEIYSFLSDLSGISDDELKSMKPADFIRLIKAVFSKREAYDFFMAVSGFLISD